ncbi:galactose-3-O-sulfotransferase 2 isoform X1 [Myripristis murdjan]|uniref:galactose-3-O-sulfotransferase 2 isoform X1 n=1 Tax=Myripristis murdjan TaxID=586833 RepID=UPI001175F077|nr:galactose-3-O-sulfotransferase 2-like isoform X1 [Myripristis murdjan]
MTFRWLATQFWRYRMAVLLLTLGVTSLLILLGTHSLQDSSYYVRQKGRSKMPTERREGLSDDASERPNNNPSQEHRGSDSHVNGYNMQMTRKISPPVAFLKTHKTGSSTVQNLLFRMGEREGATFAFPYYTYQFSYPDKFRAEFVDELPDGASQFDIICSHMRLDLGQLKQVMPPNTIYFTILRDPLQTFESIFSYYASTIPAFTLAKKAAEAAENKSALSLFLESPESYWDPKEHGNGLGKNPMSFDLGLNSQQWNSSWPADLTLLEETFQLVMIAEHFDESLVLLGALLKLQPEELAYVRLNARSTQDVTQLDDKIKARIRSWNNLDVVLYDFFVQLFWEKAEQYGLKRLKMEVARLRASTERIRQGCVAREGVPPGELEDLVRPWQTDTVTILGYQVQGNLTQQELGFCVRLVLPELQYHAHLYFQQYGRDMRAVPTD